MIRVFDGTYYEDLTINKNVSIIGNGTDSTVVISKVMILQSPEATFSDISLTVENLDDSENENNGGAEVGDEAGNGVSEGEGVEGSEQEIHSAVPLDLLIAILLVLFIFLVFVVGIDVS